MGMFHGTDAPKVAAQAVIAALESGSIKLIGPVRQDDAEEFAKTDALYLSTLLNELATKIKAAS